MPKNYSPHNPLPDTNTSPNFLALERSFLANIPICVTALGDPGTIASGTPGTASFVSWSPPANPLFDRFSFIGPAASTSLRLPGDGFYDFWMMWHVADALANYVEFKTFMDSADTSNTGIGSPSWTRSITGPSRGFDSAHDHIDQYFETLYRGVELHANDLVRFGVQIYSATALTATTVEESEFKFVYPVPNEQVGQR